MPDGNLSSLRILVVEDEFFLAEDLARVLAGVGATVVGPAPRVADALHLIENEERLDAAILDVNLGGETVFPVAAKLESRGVPFVFATGYNERDLPARYAQITRLEKGLEDRQLVPEIVRLLAA